MEMYDVLEAWLTNTHIIYQHLHTSHNWFEKSRTKQDLKNELVYNRYYHDDHERNNSVI